MSTKAKDLEQLQQSLCQSFSFCRSFPPFPSSGFHHSNVAEPNWNGALGLEVYMNYSFVNVMACI